MFLAVTFVVHVQLSAGCSLPKGNTGRAADTIPRLPGRVVAVSEHYALAWDHSQDRLTTWSRIGGRSTSLRMPQLTEPMILERSTMYSAELIEDPESKVERPLKTAVVALDIPTKRLRRMRELPFALNETDRLAFSKDKIALLRGGEDNTVAYVYNRRTARLRKVVPPSLVFNPLGWASRDRLIVTARRSREYIHYQPTDLAVWDIGTNRLHWLTRFEGDTRLGEGGASHGYVYTEYLHEGPPTGNIEHAICVVRLDRPRVQLVRVDTPGWRPLFVDDRGLLYYTREDSGRVLTRRLGD